MAQVLQLRRGTTAQSDAFTGAVAEVSVDTDRDSLRVHDGTTMGGKEIAPLQVAVPLLPAASSVSGSDTVPVIQSGVARRATKTQILNGIVNANIDAAAAIAGTKVAPAFGGQDITVSTANRSITNTGNFALSFGTNNTERMRIDASGNVGIGTASPAARVHIQTPSGSSPKYYLGQDATSAWSVGSPASTNALVFTDEQFFAERMRIDATGNVLIGRTSTAAGSAGWYFGPSGVSRGDFAAGQIFTLNRADIDGTAIQFQRNAVAVGTISVTATATAYNTSSDYRLKQNVEPMVGGLAKLAALAPKTFEFTAEPDTKVDGFIAHEVQAVVPQAVTGEKDGEQMQGLDMSKLVPVLVAAIQELSAKVEALEAAQ